MKVRIGLFFGVLLLAVDARALTLATFEDSYTGSGANGPYAGQSPDIVGSAAVFDLSRATFSRSDDGSLLTIEISGNYFSNVGALGTRLGGLFLNVDGGGSGVNGSDGASWNYFVRAFDAPTQSTTGTSHGAAGVALLNSNSSLVKSDAMNPGNWVAWRAGQEVDTLLEANAFLGLQSASWQLFSAPGGEGKLTFSLPTALFGGASVFDSQFSFSFAMTCANDVIRGTTAGVDVPEPATGVLLGFAGIAAARRRKVRARA